MGKADFLRVGDYNGICDSCGQKFKFSQLKLRWDGLYVCTVNRCWEIRQPQDYVRGVMDRQAVPISRPDAPPVYIQDETVTETLVITLSFIKSLYRILAVSVSSVASIIKTVYPFTAPTKVVNGAAVNQTTLG